MECQGPATVVFEKTLTDYDFGPDHPMAPVRVDLTMRLADDLGVLDRLRIAPAPIATIDQIATVHDPALIEAVTACGNQRGHVDLARGLGTDDNPVFLGMHEAASHVVGASLEAFRQVWTGESLHAANITGGLHHAMRGNASGFCIYNDVAVGIQYLLDQGAERVAYVGFTDDGGLVSASWDGTVLLWDLSVLDVPAAALARRAEQTWGTELALALRDARP